MDDQIHGPLGYSALVISENLRGLRAVETALRSMLLLEAKITTAGTMSAAFFALACDGFDLVVSVGGHASAVELVEFARRHPHVLAVATNAAEETAFLEAGIEMITQRDVTPARLQSLIRLRQTEPSRQLYRYPS
jgi:hypothetical protein